MAALALAALLRPDPAAAMFFPQGPKLVGTAAVGTSAQGVAVALSADGNTALVGGKGDNGEVGAVWVYTRANGEWAQQGAKLLPSDAAGAARFGISVALSADGNTALIGGNSDNGNKGAAWVFRRDSGGGWSQQGAKLIGSPAGISSFGSSVALSADGDTALIGGHTDDNEIGAAWVFTRLNGGWTQDGPKLVGSGYSGASRQGYAVSLSANGALAAIGGYADDSRAGAVWMFARGATWTQVGGKLSVGENADFGGSVALSGDGRTLIAGGGSLAKAAWVFTEDAGSWSMQAGPLALRGENTAHSAHRVAISYDGSTALIGVEANTSFMGAAWSFRRNFAGQWNQFGSVLGGSGSSFSSYFGASVALSADGRTAIIGGFGDNGAKGAAWPFLALGQAAHDFNADQFSDILWRHSSSGQLAMWLMTGASYVAVAAPPAASAWTIIGQRDFNGDGRADILWARDSHVVLWLMNGAEQIGFRDFGSVSGWSAVALGDFNADGHSDILWRNASGDLAMWVFSAGNVSSVVSLGNVPMSWAIAGAADVTGDGKSDIVWRDSSGTVAIWTMDGVSVSAVNVLGAVANSWSIVDFGDINADQTADILWRSSGGVTAAWLMFSGPSYAVFDYGLVGTEWSLQFIGDYNGDGESDVLWRHADGALAIWRMNGAVIDAIDVLGAVAPEWSVQGRNAN